MGEETHYAFALNVHACIAHHAIDESFGDRRHGANLAIAQFKGDVSCLTRIRNCSSKNKTLCCVIRLYCYILFMINKLERIVTPLHTGVEIALALSRTCTHVHM